MLSSCCNGWNPGASNQNGLLLAGPRRHCDGHCRDGPRRRSPKLETGANRNCEADTRLKWSDLFALALLSPHFALASQDKPDFLDRAVNYSAGDLARSKLKVSHAASGQAQEDPHIGAVGCDNRRLGGKTLCSELTHATGLSGA